MRGSGRCVRRSRGPPPLRTRPAGSPPGPSASPPSPRSTRRGRGPWSGATPWRSPAPPGASAFRCGEEGPMIADPRHRLDDRSRGWLRYIWEKATTADDWSIDGEPHPWWDRYSTPPLCSLARFDLHETGYVLPVMCDVTPAWPEVYTRIADELLGRYTTFWSVIDWVTMIGHDPNADRHPPEWLAYTPEHLR